MPRHSPYRLAWQSATHAYVLRGPAADQETGTRSSDSDSNSAGLALAPDTPAWREWLATASSFAFASRDGPGCTVRKESVQRGGGYWYAYRRSPQRQGRMAKRYLGRDADLTLARLEEAAAILSAPAHRPMPAPALVPMPTHTLPALPHAPQQEAPVPVRPVTAAPAVPPPDVRWGTSTPPEPPHALQPLQPLQLLTTKLHVPRGASRLVSRPHVEQRLRRGLERPLALLALLWATRSIRKAAM